MENLQILTGQKRKRFDFFVIYDSHPGEDYCFGSF